MNMTSERDLQHSCAMLFPSRASVDGSWTKAGTCIAIVPHARLI